MKGLFFELFRKLNEAGEGEGGAPDIKNVYEEQIKNLKSEFSRKIDNLTNSQQALIEAINGMAATKEAPPTDTYNPYGSDVIDPVAFAAKVAQDVEKKVTHTLENKNKQQQQLASLMSDFPELQDRESELTKLSMEIYSSMPKEEQAHSLSGKLAIQEAALKLGLTPKSKRSKSSDMGYVGNSGEAHPRINKTESKKVSKGMLEFAKALNIDINDKSYADRLSKFVR